MAIMIPSTPEFDKKSYEELIFNSLKQLPDNCFVLHSLSILDPESENKGKKETEIDFIVIIPDVGLIVIEAKSGRVCFSNSKTYFEGEEIPAYTWLYESGRPMKGNGPFRQSRDNMYSLMAYLKNTPYSNMSFKQKFYNCIWLHQIKKNIINSFPKRTECPKELILCKEDLESPYESLLKIIEFENPTIKPEGKIPWNYDEASIIISHVLAPTMNLVPGKNWEYEYKNEALNKLLIEQERILEFLSEQKVAVISGAAGTGKTMIALKKAEIESQKGKKVLFLCYNSALSEFLEENYKKENIEFYNISKWACKICNSRESDYAALSNKIDELLIYEKFPYQTIIVDEAQDFGQEVIDNKESCVLEKLYEAMILKEGLMYLFYDKNQIINSNTLPLFIKDADCKLTLYRNCRNTKRIANTSLKVLKQNGYVGPNVVEGEMPDIIFADSKNIFDILNEKILILNKKYSNIVILTAKTINTTSYYEKVEGQRIKIGSKFYPFYSCRQYKGLEADAVILVDVDKDTFVSKKHQLLFYVGASRAKFDLSIIVDMSINDCEDVCKYLLEDSFIDGYDYHNQFAMALAAVLNK